MKTIEIDLNMNPIERLQIEIDNEEDSAVKYLGELLKKEFAVNELITKAYKDKTRTLKDSYKALEDYAREQRKSCIDDNEALGVVLHYIQDGEVKQYINKKIVLSKEEELDLKEQARQQFIEAEKLRLRQEENERLQKEQEAKLKHQEKEQAKFDKISETQMSLFDL